MRLTVLLTLLPATTAFAVPSRHRNVASLHSTAEDTETQLQVPSDVAQAAIHAVEVANESIPTHAEKPATPQFSTPAESENAKFQCDDTVQFWIDYNIDGHMEAQDYIRNAVDVSNRFLNKGSEARNYWLRHNARTGYFFTNAALGTAASQLHERLRSKDVPADGFASSMAQPQVISRLLAEAA